MSDTFDSLFTEKMNLVEEKSDLNWTRYSNLAFEYDYSPREEDPQDSFERTLNTIRFDELIWGREDGE